MARNEEKQLARLNRYYLQQQKEEELKKRPPRPRLDTLNSVDDVKKWLPSILRDIDFYVKQMEVPCYPKRQIDEFERRIDQLRGEYKAFIRKLRQLEPDLDSTPWSDRPYSGKRKKTGSDKMITVSTGETIASDGKDISTNHLDQIEGLVVSKNFIPLATPVLKNDSFYQQCYGYQKPKEPDIDDADLHMQDKPLQFSSSYKALEYTKNIPNSELDSKQNLYCDAPLDFDWHGSNTQEGENLYAHDKCERVPNFVGTVAKDCRQEACTPTDEYSQQLQPEQTSFPDEVQKRLDLHCTNNRTHVYSHVGSGISYGGSADNTEEVVSGHSGAIGSQHSRTSGVIVHNSLNIPYTDSSSSDEDT